MTSPVRSTSALRRPLAVASVLALTSGLAMGLAPAAGAAGNGGNGGVGGSYGGGIQSSRPNAASGVVVGHGSGGNGGAGGTGPIECTDANLDRLARATGGELHTLEQDGHCLVVHRFATSDTFTITARVPFPMQALVVGGGGGAGGGSGWEDSLKASGAEPESGAGAGGAGGDVQGGDVVIDASTGAFTYTPKDVGKPDPDCIHCYPTLTSTGPTPRPKNLITPIPVTVGRGGNGGNAGSSAAGSTVGGQGATGGDSSFGDLVAHGGWGGFGGRGAEGSEPGVQFGWAESPRAGGRKGGSNSNFWGGDLGIKKYVDFAAPGGAGASENGQLPIAVGTTGNGGNGGAGVSVSGFTAAQLRLGDGGGGGTISPASPPFSPVVGGAGGNGGSGGLLSVGGAGGAGGVGQDAPDGFGGGGGGGGTDGSVTPGDSNAGRGGDGGDGIVYVRYLAAAAPVAPPAPTVVAGDGSVTLSFERFDDAADFYVLWVAGDPTRTCTITPPETSCVIDGLTNGENYQFLAYAGNTAGESDTSSASLTATPGTGILPYTGTNTRGLASIALTMIGLGGAATALTRRRRTIS